MAEQETQSSSAEQTTSSDGTLDQVYKDFNVEEMARSFNPQTQQTHQQAQPVHIAQQPAGADIPDPILDAAGFKAYLARNNQENSQARSTLIQHIQQLTVGETKRKIEADVKSAVSAVKSKVGAEVDDEFVEALLDVKARKDPRFKVLFNNRERNPAAWNAALGAIGNEIKSKHQFRADPQLTENVRAAKTHTQASQTKSQHDDGKNSLERQLAGAKNAAEFDAIWSRAVHG